MLLELVVTDEAFEAPPMIETLPICKARLVATGKPPLKIFKELPFDAIDVEFVATVVLITQLIFAVVFIEAFVVVNEVIGLFVVELL